jgi:hypothetical protein
MNDHEGVRAAALAAAAAPDVRAALHEFVDSYHDPRVLRRVHEGLELERMRHPDDPLIARAEALVASALASVEHSTLTQ